MRKLEREQQERNAAFKKDVVSPVKRKLKAEKAPIPQIDVSLKHTPTPPVASLDSNHIAAKARHEMMKQAKMKAGKAPIPQVKVPPKHPPAPPAASSDPNHVAANMRHDAEAKMRHDTAAKMRHEMMKHTQKKQALKAAFEKDVVKPVMRRLKRNAWYLKSLS
jgi:hypothetical protein